MLDLWHKTVSSISSGLETLLGFGWLSVLGDAIRGYGTATVPWENMSSSSHPSCWGGGSFRFGPGDEGIGREEYFF